MDFKNVMAKVPTCNNNKIDMSFMYFGNSNVTGNPVCGDNVVDMNYAYAYCANLIGDPVCGNRVMTMDCTYYNCNKLSGCAICGPNVISMSGTYANCINIAENAYFYSPNVEYVGGCFAGKDNTKRLNIYVPENSITLDSCLSEEHAFSLVAQDILWTYDENNKCYYNNIYNIYIYPVNNVSLIRIQNNN